MILPELDLPSAQAMKQIAACAKIAQKNRAIARLAVIIAFKLNKKQTEKLAERLRLSNEQKSSLAQLIEGRAQLQALGEKPADAMEFIDECETNGGENSFEELFLPTWEILCPSRNLEHAKDTEAKLKHLRKMNVPVNGKDLTSKYGIAPGPKMGKILQELKRSFRNQEWQKPEEGLALVKKFIQ